MQTISLDMYTSLALATVLLIWGKFLSRKIQFFRTYSIPEPVIGGLSFAIIAMVLRQKEILAFEFDTTLQTLAMIVFFTTVGFNANFATLKVGSKKVILFLISAILLATFQNVVAVGLSKVLGIDLFVGLATGSTPMTGGHGTSIAIGEQLEAIGVLGTQAIAVTAATFGLVAGSMIGGPLANHLIKKYDLVTKKLNSTSLNAFDDLEDEILSAHPLEPSRFVNAAFQIAIAIGVGMLLNPLIAKSGLNFPVYIGPMIAAVVIRNVCETRRFPSTPMEEVDITSSISLQFFLAIALMNLKLWELAGMAGPIVILLSAQVILMLLHARFITFKMMGSNYDAAVLAGGHCGFGMGATPNGMANITSITGKYIPSRMAFFVLPIVGSLFIDLFNISIIQVFINLIS